MKQFCFFGFVFFVVRFNGLSQQIELSVQTGHSSAINTIAFSAGDDLIASGGADNKIILWDFLTSKQAALLLGHKAAITDLVFHPRENILLSSSMDSTVKIWDTESSVCLATIKFDYAVWALAIQSDGLGFAVAGKEIVLFSRADSLATTDVWTKNRVSSSPIWSAENKKVLPIRAKKSFTCIAYNPDATMLAFGGSAEDLAYVVNLSEKSLERKITAAWTDITFDSSSNNVIYATSSGQAGEICLNKRDKKSTSTDWMLNSYNAAECNSQFIFLGNDIGEVRVIARGTFREVKILKSKHARINDVELSNGGSFLASAGDGGRIVIWDLSTFHAVKDMEGSVSQINDIAFSKDGNEILIAYQDGSLRKTNLFSNQSLVNSPQSNSDFAMSRFTWSAYEILAFEKDSAIFTMHKKRYSIEDENAFDKLEEFIVIWNFKENLLTLKEQEELTNQAAIYNSDRKKGIVRPTVFLLNPDLKSVISQNSQISIQSDGTDLTIVDRLASQPHRFNSEHSDRVTSIAINDEFGFFATAGWDGLIRFRDLKSGELLTTFGPFDGGQFIYINPQGYYFSSKKALDYVGFRVDERLYSFEQFDVIFNRPDLVAANLPYYDSYYVDAYKNAYLKRLKKLGLSEDMLYVDEGLPTIQYERNTESLIRTGEIQLKVSCFDKLHELDKLHLKINGVPEFGRFGKKIQGNSYVDSFMVELNPGTNYFQFYCTNKNGVASYQESFSVEAHKKNIESDLFLVSIGVSKYKEQQYNLNFAAKDAEDIHRYFNRPFGPFSNIHTKLLVDSTVTLSNIYGLKSFLDQAKPNDVVMVFVAGHGVLDLNFDYYLATHDMDFNNPQEKGIPYELFDELLDNTKSRKKVMFLDACHSGEIDKEDVIKTEVSTTEQGDIKFRSAGINIANKEQTNSLDLAKSLFADMRLNNGTTVISSSGGTEFAIESDNWRNGAFTYCLLYGLSSGDADLNKNKLISLSELQQYLLFQVNKLTNGAQTPTSRAENLNNDFILK